jgi:hypothetical protein
MSKRILVGLALLLGSFIHSASLAEDIPIQFGQPVTGTLTNDQYEFHYTFTGQRGQVILVEMKAASSSSNVFSPVLILLSPEGKTIADTSDAFSFQETLLATELPTDGTFTIVATRADGAKGKSVGDFMLELILPKTLTLDNPISDQVTRAGGDAYYVASADTPFHITYTKQEGAFFPQVSVNRIDSQLSSLNEVALLSGVEFTAGTLDKLDADTTYIVAVGESPLDYSEDDVTATYTLEAGRSNQAAIPLNAGGYR